MQLYFSVFLLSLFTSLYQVFGQNVPADKTMEANLGSNIVLEWDFDGSSTFNNVQSSSLYVETIKPDNFLYLIGNDKELSGNGKKLFPNDRLVVDDASLDTGTLKLTLKNVEFKDEKKKFVLQVVYNNAFPKTSTITIDPVKGGPVLCNNNTLKSEYTFSENGTPTISVTFCGNQKPTIKWSFNSKDITDNASDSPVETLVHGYKYDVVLPSLTQNVCGKILSSSVSGNSGNNVISNTAKIFVNFVPAEIQNIVFFQESSTCNSVEWSALDVGDCEITYNVEYLNETSNSIFNATNITTLRDCRTESLGATSVRVWAMYSNEQGKISNLIRLSLTTTTTTTTATTTTTKPTQKGKTGGSTSDDDGGSNIGAIVGAVCGVILLIIIIIVVLIYCKKKKNGTIPVKSAKLDNKNANVVRDDEMELKKGGSFQDESDYASVNSKPLKKENPDQGLYAELGAGGGRKAPKPDPAQSNYAEVKVDEMGYPARGPTSDAPTIPPTYAQAMNRDLSRRYSPPPKDLDDMDEGIIV